MAKIDGGGLLVRQMALLGIKEPYLRILDTRGGQWSV